MHSFLECFDGKSISACLLPERLHHCHHIQQNKPNFISVFSVMTFPHWSFWHAQQTRWIRIHRSQFHVTSCKVYSSFKGHAMPGGGPWLVYFDPFCLFCKSKDERRNAVTLKACSTAFYVTNVLILLKVITVIKSLWHFTASINWFWIQTFAKWTHNSCIIE